MSKSVEADKSGNSSRPAGAAVADVPLDLAGFSLGEKKAIKEAIASGWEPAKKNNVR